ncbi:hypothetical protein ADL26_13920, partial [Thermoactinomyces vulgaris]
GDDVAGFEAVDGADGFTDLLVQQGGVGACAGVVEDGEAAVAVGRVDGARDGVGGLDPVEFLHSRLDLVAVAGLARYHDGVAVAAGDREASVLDVREVAGAEPAVGGEGAAVDLGVVVVAAEDRGAGGLEEA